MRFLTNTINGRLPGFSLMELALIIAITSILMVGLTAVVFQMLNNREHSQSSLVADEQARNAYYWLNRDGLRSQTTQIGDDPETLENEVLYLIWVGSMHKDQYNNELADLYEIKYILENNELSRTQKLTTGIYDSEGSLVGMGSSNTTILVAQVITDLMISSENHSFKFLLTANVEDVETIKSFQVEQRAAGNY